MGGGGGGGRRSKGVKDSPNRETVSGGGVHGNVLLVVGIGYNWMEEDGGRGAAGLCYGGWMDGGLGECVCCREGGGKEGREGGVDLPEENPSLTRWWKLLSSADSANKGVVDFLQ